MITITLQNPVQKGDRTIHKLQIRQPKAGDMLVIDDASGMMSMTFKLLEKLTGESSLILQEMQLDDFLKAQEVIESFLQPFLVD